MVAVQLRSRTGVIALFTLREQSGRENSSLALKSQLGP